MAPELHKGLQYYSSVDWWAIGIILYELTFGLNPFNLENKTISNNELKE